MRTRLLLLTPLLGIALLLPAQPAAAVTCPNANPVVHENNCMGPGSSAWQLSGYDPDGIRGYATQSSVDLGQGVTLRLAIPGGDGHADVDVFRMGWYGGAGGRLVYQADNVAVENSPSCNPPDFTTGNWDCDNWENTLTVPGAALPASGIYLARIQDAESSDDNHVIFTVRDDDRDSDLLYKLPTSTYQAYNNFNGHSLYTYNSAGFATITGLARAVKVSFDRPYKNVFNDGNWFLKADFPLVAWLEHQGYEVDYTESIAVDADPDELLDHEALVLSGHDEYWSEAEMDGYKAARDAGVGIASFSANTAYWKVRYEDGGRTLVCYKSVEGARIVEGARQIDGSLGVNDWGPDGLEGTDDDALGKDGIAGTGDDNPEFSTTTWRDNGATPGDPNAPPEGRVGPDDPENSLLGAMYVGDNDNVGYSLGIPATNEVDEFAGDRIWRNSGVSETSATTIGGKLVGWEWDTIPTQAQYVSRQPAGVKRVTQTNTGTAPNPPNWIQDEGLIYAQAPPPGQPVTVSAVKYTAPSGALVFHAGTNQWSWGLGPHYIDRAGSEDYEDPATDSSDPRIQQATYNVIADMEAQPQTPAGIVIDGNDPPAASFTATPNPAAAEAEVAFDASGSSDSDGTIVKYEWDLDGNGSYETNTGATASATKAYASAGERTIALRVTDSGGATDLATRTLTITNGAPGNVAPQASFTASPNPAPVGEQVTFNASGSSDSDGTIVKYEWDLDGNGSYETNTGATASATQTYAAEGSHQIGLRVTDDDGAKDQTARTLIVGEGGTYHARVLGTPGLAHYWRLGEVSGTVFSDSIGSSPAAILNGVTLGAPSLLSLEEGDAAASFDGLDDAAAAAVNLSGTAQVTIEFWLNWAAYANNDDLAFELTSNFNDINGGFLVDPNAAEMGGQFGIGIGRGTSRNNVYFARPSAGAWHHYAFVLDTAAPASQQIVPYVDGDAVSFSKLNSGTGAGNFANSTLYFMSRNASTLAGNGVLDEVALYDRALSGGEIAQHFNPNPNQPPQAAFAVSPNPAAINEQVAFDASGSSDSDGTIVKYEWDLDGNGSYETNTGASPSAARSFATTGTHTVGLRVTDGDGATATTTHNVTVQNTLPTASFTVTPNPTPAGESVAFDGSASSDPDGSIVRYEWDLDGNGEYEVDTDTSPEAARAFEAAGGHQVGLRVTDDSGNTATTTRTVTVLGDYGASVSETPGLGAYWRLDESAGTTFADSAGDHDASTQGGVALGVAGALGQDPDPDPAASFDGLNDGASAQLDLSVTSELTVEFWLNWDSYANDDDLAMELTSNFNNVDGGFLIDPNAPEMGGQFGIGIGRGTSRNNVYFARPSAGAWHHYAFVLDTAAPASQQIVPYVDGDAVSFSKLNSGTGAGNFANSTLYFMSRNASTLFGAGDLDEVAIYDRVLGPAEVADHYFAAGFNRPPQASFTATPSPASTGEQVAFDASGSSDSDGTIAKYEWDLDGNGSYETNTGASPNAARSFATAGTHTVGLRVTDDGGDAATTTRTVTVQDTQPTASFTVAPNPAPAGESVAFDGSASSDPDGSIVRYEWDLDGNGEYEVDTDTSPEAARAFEAAGDRTIGLRVTDDGGATATTTRTVTVLGPYPTAVATTPDLGAYWRLGESAGTTFADSAGDRDANAQGGVALGVAGAPTQDSDPAASFDGLDDAASAQLDLSATSELTVEFWLNWDSYANNDDLAMELTSNFNNVDGGFLIDPNADALGGRFGVAIGRGASRNTTYFQRPSAGEWHHYAFVLDSAAPAAQQVLPYVDGLPVEFTKFNSGTGAGNFANSTLYFMSRNASALFGAGDLDEVAIYERALDVEEIADHYYATGANRPPQASFTVSPNPVAIDEQVEFDASASSDPDGSIVRYEWDLDGDGSFEIDTDTSPNATRSYEADGDREVALRVTDESGAVAVATQTLSAYGPYGATVKGTPGVVDYWRMGESSGSIFVDTVGGHHATLLGGVTLGVAGALGGDPSPAASFDGIDDSAVALVDLSTTSQVTVEFWLKWAAYANDDDLALELTPNFNNVNGGFLVDPNADALGGRFGVAIGRGPSRNTVYFQRPSAGAWHHYAFVLDSAAPAANQILPYVDGQPIEFTKLNSGTGAGNFADSTLYFMSRNASALFGGGALDEVALYKRALSPAEITEHHLAGG